VKHRRWIDIFAGASGAGDGIRRAGGKVVWAGNHWELACDTNRRNNPGTIVVCQDLRQFDWRDLPDYDGLWGSPACQGHSSAAQPNPRPHHDADRSTAWAVIDCIEATRPKVAIVENVKRWARWVLFPLWLEALKRLGYFVEVRSVMATECGVPQRRERLFVSASLKPIARRLRQSPMVEPPFGPCIEHDASGWRPISRSTPDAQVRIRRAQSISGRRCLVQHVTGHPGVPLDEPIRTITTKDQWILVDGNDCRPLTLREYARAMGFPDSYVLPDAPRADVVKLLGNAVPPPMAENEVRQVAA
jgi:DNA (cytosine-5)-methyltransferase 1